MNRRFAALSCIVVFTCVAATLGFGLNKPADNVNPPFASFEFHRDAAATHDAAAKALFRGISTESPKHFVQHLLVGVCDNSIDTLQKFAECLHRTTFSDGKQSVTVYDLPKRMDGETIRVVASQPFSTDEVDSLRGQYLSTYYCEDDIVCVEVAGKSYDGNEYRTRIVVAKLSDGWEQKGGWYALPRGRSAKSFYAIADAMQFEPAAAKDTQ